MPGHPPAGAWTAPRSRRFSRVLALAAALIAAVALLGRSRALGGWDGAVLARWSDASIPMHPTTAVAILFLGWGLFAKHSWQRQLAAALGELVNISVVVAGLVWPQLRDGMADETLLSLTCLALVMWGSERGWARWLLHLLVLVGVANAYLVLIGYWYNVPELYAALNSVTMALPTSVAALFLGLGIALGIPRGLADFLVNSPTPDATLLRVLTPVSLVILPLIGYGIVWSTGHSALQYGKIVMAAIVAAIVLFNLGLARAALLVREVYRSQQRAAQELARVNASLKDGRDEAWARAEATAAAAARDKARHEEVVGLTGDIVWSLTLDSNEAWTISYVSPHAEAILGAPVPADQIMQTLSERIRPDFQESNRIFSERMVQEGRAENELPIVGLDGVTRWVWARTMTHRDQHGTLHCDGVLTDISERREMEERQSQLLQAEVDQVRRLQAFAQMREEFMTVAGHELRTPLAAVQGYCELLDEQPLGAEARSFVEVIARRSGQLNELVQEFFDLTRLNAGTLDLTMDQVEMGSLLQGVFDDQRPLFEAHNITATVEALPGAVRGDAARLRQCLGHLLVNATKYNRTGGSVWLRGRSERHTYVVEVGDTGVGISPESLERIFEHFFRVEGVDHRTTDGTGLGLSVTRALVEAHGGRITATSVEGEGSVFTLRLPLANASSVRPTQGDGVPEVRVGS